MSAFAPIIGPRPLGCVVPHSLAIWCWAMHPLARPGRVVSHARGDGGGPSECDNKYHFDDTPVVALSTGWYGGGSRCLNNIVVSGNGRSVTAMVVDECHSTMGCDEDHGYQPPFPNPNNIVDASKDVWKALGVPEGDGGELDITWSDA
ncbi:hypothetical protein DH2020_023735 [Rehmannia glutinosa]|uniref:Ripening-related protein n=1 Tax=Rehmannia glutinosa TaxID=99300 RepID=A0ABR0W6X5_REHGL